MIDGFVQREPNEGKPPSFRTEARVVYDRSALYVSIRAFDTDPSKIVGILTRRDTDSPSDWVSIIVDSYHDRRTAYEFAVNAAGVKLDKYRFADRNEDASWDAVWDVKVVTRRGRLARAVPHPLLAAPLRPEEGRHVRLRRHAACRAAQRDVHVAAAAAQRERLRLVARRADRACSCRAAGSGSRWCPTPSASCRRRKRRSATRSSSRRDAASAFGADMKFAVTPGLTLTGTINPDFGQVEADPAVVNLSAFETYFAERRPFFVEGSGIFRFDIDCNDGECRGLFYSRRIGRTPRGTPPVTDGGYLSVPSQTTILGAAKLTGRVGLVLGRRAERGDARGARLRVERPRAHLVGGRADHQLHRGARHARVREPVVARLHGHRAPTAA